jgi:hypothetical protein
VQWSDNYGLVTFTSRNELHDRWGPSLRRLVHRGWTGHLGCSSGPPGILLDSQGFLALRWTMPRMVLRDIASWHLLYLVAKPSHMGVDVDGLANPLHHPVRR